MSTPQWALERIQEAKEKELVSLNLSRSRQKTLDSLKIIPNEVFELSQLMSLDLSHNELTSLPEDLNKLQSLKVVDLNYNLLTNLAESITELPNLTTLDLSNNKLVNLPESIANLQKLIKLRLDNNHLTIFSECITKLENLTILNLSNNSFTELPTSLNKLQNLMELYLTGNELIDLPEAISELRNLTELYLGRNLFNKFPEAITKLQTLSGLYFSKNLLTELPESISRLHNLIELYLNDNEFVSFPESIIKLRELESLNLSGNQIVDLPLSVNKLQSLTMLDLSNNRLVHLSESICDLQNLTTLGLQSNQLLTPPQEVAEKGIAAIREYFRQLGRGQDYLYEAKLLILGEGGAGKTTLANKIQNSTYVLQDEISTEGVDIRKWLFPIEGKGRDFFRVNIWDFGGQEIYHATHQFFLTKRSLYVLVADTRKEDTDFYYWLNVVDLLSDNSPLLIIKNEKQDRHRDLNERQLRGQYDNLKAVLSTNLKTNRGLNEIKDEIEHYIKRLPHVGSPLPKTWVRVRERLEDDKRNYISLEEYIDVCKENGFTESKDSLQLSSYLNDIGVFLHFQDDPLLRKTVILKLKWGTDAAYKVLDNGKIIRNLGQFTRADLEEIWDASEYKDMHDELLQLMMKFKLCYEIPGHKGVYIAPQLLTENQPYYEWTEEENLLLRYTYEFMPKGILLQFIVVMSENIWKQTVWKSGVVLEKDKTRAEVIEYYGKRQIHVRIAGAHKKELITIIDHELEQIHATYRRLKYDKLIPCNCSECRVNQEPHFYHFERLKKFQEDRQDQIQCQHSYQMVSVRGLTDDIKGWKSEKEVEEIMAKQKRSDSSGINIGDNFSGTIITGVVKSSFNKIESANVSNELKETLKQFVQAVEAMRKSLPDEQATEVAEDLEKLVEEATKENPKQRWYSVSIEGLTKAAENIGKVGEPVIELAGKVLKLLAIG